MPKTLVYHFFEEISTQFPGHFASKTTSESRELEKLRQENELLKRIVEV